MGVSFSAAASGAGVFTAESCAAEVFAAVVAAAGLAETFAETEAAGPLADRLASPAPERRVGGAAVAPVAARVGVGTALPAALFLTDAFAACVAPVAASDALVLLVVTAVILAL
ncbi:hypothetical protein [Catenulispora sp. MAP12-49]